MQVFIIIIINVIQDHINKIFKLKRLKNKGEFTMEKLYVTDLDGTLLRNNATLSEFSRRNLSELIKNKDLKFTIATARALPSVRYILKDLPLNIPVIENNGAYVTDYKTGKHLIVNSIEEKLAKDILYIISMYKSSPYVSACNESEDKLFYGDVINEGMQLLLNDKIKQDDKRLNQVQDINCVLSNKIVGFTVINKEKELTPIFKILKEKYGKLLRFTFEEDQYYPGWHWLTINSCNATKAKAIDTVRSIMGFDKEHLTVFGDNTNDIPMFEIAHEGVATSNAKQELKKYATKIIGSNEEDSVVKYILKDQNNG